MPTGKLTVVIADDDALIRSAYRTLLEQNGYSVRLADNGLAVMSIVEAEPVDVVLLDILMPQKEGLETLLELKQRFPHIKVFAMSNGSGRRAPDFLAIATKFGADAALQKPFGPDVLIRLLNGSVPSQQAS